MIPIMFRTLWKVLLLAVIITLLAIFGHDLADQTYRLEDWIRAQGVWAPFFFTLALLILPMIFFPLDPLCFAAGVLFGFGWGSFYAGMGLLASASLMFVLARYLARGTLTRYFSKSQKMRRVNHLVSKGGFKILVILRILPIPFSLLSYYLGVTSVRFKHYFWSVFGTAGTILVGVYAGSVAKSIAKMEHSVGHFIGLGLAIVLMLFLVQWARKTMKQIEPSLVAD
jgi:uncharacterized membrane protein YdjX (TVP38/TMEM64 family)